MPAFDCRPSAFVSPPPDKLCSVCSAATLRADSNNRIENNFSILISPFSPSGLRMGNALPKDAIRQKDSFQFVIFNFVAFYSLAYANTASQRRIFGSDGTCNNKSDHRERIAVDDLHCKRATLINCLNLINLLSFFFRSVRQHRQPGTAASRLNCFPRRALASNVN